MKTVKILTILALVTMVCSNEVSEASFLDEFNTPGLVTYTGSNSYGSGGVYTVSGGKLRITTGADNTYSVMTSNTVEFNIGDILSLDVPAVSGTESVFMMCSTSAAQPNGTSTFGFRFRRDGVMYARMDLYPGGIQANTLDPNPDLPAKLIIKRTSDTYFEYSIKIEGVQTNLGSFILPSLSGIYNLHIGAQAYKQTSGTTFAFDNLQVYNPNFTDITVLTYNTHLFEDSPLECIARCAEFWSPELGIEWADFALEDGARRDTIAAYVRSSGADIVALQEVWSYGYRNWIKNTLSDAYPYSYFFEIFCDSSYGLNKIHDHLITCIDAWGLVYLPSDDYTRRYSKLGNGLVLLSKWPLQNIQHPIFPAYNCGMPGTECWAHKGVFTATVNINGAPIRIGISHALTGPDDYKSNWDTDCVGTATFQFNGEPYIFSLNNINGLAHIRRFEDYSYFNEATKTQKHGAGWKQIYEGLWGLDYVAVTSFELDGHPYLFGLKSSNQGRIFRINDDPATGWTQVYEGPMSSSYIPVTSFELDGHPYLFAVRDSNQGRILRINDDPSTGWSDVYDGNWPAGYDDIASFELDGHPYIFTHSDTHNLAHIYRINNDPCTGWSDMNGGAWPSGYADITSFELDSHPYIFTYSNTNHWAYIYGINDDPCTGWSDVSDGNMVFTDYIAIKSFEMNGHPYLFAQRDCCGQNYNPCGFPLPGEAYLKRINDDPNTGWENLLQLEDIRIIRDQTVVDEDGPPAIMIGDFNIHRGKYGIMDELFGKAGTVDAYAQVADAAQDGNTCDYNNNNLYKYFWERDPEFDPTNPDNVDRIDYIYVKQSGAGLRLVPTEAHVERGWTYYSSYAGTNWDLSDHYPLFATFRFEIGCAAMKADFNCDRLVDIFDLAILCSAWLSEPNASSWNLACDVSEPSDEIVNLKDYTELARQWKTMPVHNITQDKWYEAIQAAINDANNGEEIEASPGYYYEAIDFKGKAITLRSADPNNPNIVAATVINGFGHYHVVKCVTGEDANTVLAGFTITGGNANGPTDAEKSGGGMYTYYSRPTVTNCTFADNSASFYGGGMYNYQSSPTVTNCMFTGNSVSFYDGGGMFNHACSPTVTDCIFSNNTANRNGGGMYNGLNSNPTVTRCTFAGNKALSAYYGGGGMVNNNACNPTVKDCIFRDNTAIHNAGGMYNINNSSPTVTKCTFNYNNAGGSGGGMDNSDSSSPTVTNCTFSDNQASYGGGMDNYNNSAPTVTNCTFSGNNSRVGGGGVCNSTSSSPKVTNCSFSGNQADSYGGGMYSYNSSPTVTNCILWGNTAPTGPQIYGGNPTITYSDVEGKSVYPGAGNINADPCFVDAIGGDLHLSTPNSPCVDAGNNNAIPADTPDLDGDGDTTEPIPFDLDGGPRVWNNIVDMGAYEYLVPPPPISSADNFEYLSMICADWLAGTEPEL